MMIAPIILLSESLHRWSETNHWQWGTDQLMRMIHTFAFPGAILTHGNDMTENPQELPLLASKDGLGVQARSLCYPE